MDQAATKPQGRKNPTTTKKPQRNTLSFEPCGPIRSMIADEMKRHGCGRGALKKVLEAAVIAALAPKYPKLHQRYLVLKEEGAL